MKEQENYYEVLEVPISASMSDIHNSYQRIKNAYSTESLAMYSLVTQDESQRFLDLLEEAYAVLSIPEKRAEYDKVRNFSYQKPGPQLRGLDSAGSHNHQHFDLTESTMMEAQSIGFQRDHGQGQSLSPNPTSSSQDFVISRKEAEVSKISARNRYSLSYQVRPDVENEIEKTQTFTGAVLQKIREYKNVDIPRMAEMTKVSKSYIRNIEAEDYLALPAPVYTRGFVYQYAKCLKLDPDQVANSYLKHIKGLKENKNPA